MKKIKKHIITPLILTILFLSGCSFIIPSLSDIANSSNDDISISSTNNPSNTNTENSDHGSSNNSSASSSDENVTSLNKDEALVTIYATNDIHGQMSNSGSYADSRRMFSYMLDNCKDENSLLLDQGDTWQGSLESNNKQGEVINKMMNYVGYNARTIGNHDFDWGEEYLKKNTADEYNGYRTPVLGANIYDYNFESKIEGTTFQSDLGKKSVTYVLDNNLKVGIVGVIGHSQITSITSSYVKNICFKDEIEVIKEEATNLKEEGCNIIIASVHAPDSDLIGYNLNEYVDLVLCGHTHRIEHTYEENLLYAQFGAYNQQIGKIDLVYNYTTKEVTSNLSQIESSVYKNYPISKEIQSICSPYIEEINSISNTVVANNISGTFYSNAELPNLMAKAMYTEAINQGYDIDLAYVNNARRTLYPNYWSYSYFYNAFPFESKVYVMDITTQELMDEVNDFNFIYKNPSLSNVIDRNKTYRIATIDYLALHTNQSRYYDYFRSVDEDDLIYIGTYRDILLSYLENEGYGSGTLLSAADYSSSLDCFTRNFSYY